MTSATSMDWSASNEGGILSMTYEQFTSWAVEKSNFIHERDGDMPQEKDKKGKFKKITFIQLLLSKESGFATLGKEVLEHVLLSCNMRASSKADDLKEFNESTFCKLQEELRNGSNIVHSLNVPGQPGYILLMDNAQNKGNEMKSLSANRDYFEFVPRIFRQHEGKVFIEFPSFNEAVDEYFCKVNIIYLFQFCDSLLKLIYQG